MKTKRIIFLVLGWLFIAINVMGYLGSIARKVPLFEGRNISFILGFHFWFMLGGLFLLLANKQKHKIQRAKEKQELDSFLVEQ